MSQLNGYGDPVYPLLSDPWRGALINHSNHPTHEPRYEYCVLRGWTLLYSTLNGRCLLRRFA